MFKSDLKQCPFSRNVDIFEYIQVCAKNDVFKVISKLRNFPRNFDIFGQKLFFK